ncbi:hypothetical protein [Marinicrinis lubricantis]|uniref:Uncharacterized protein n=1 Tax=Marinicrinis lubricantis TaxID=2086470 RepID=A0ABW1IQB6_9BACL
MAEIVFFVTAAVIAGIVEGRKLYRNRWMKELVFLLILLTMIIGMSIYYGVGGKVVNVLDIVLQLFLPITGWIQDVFFSQGAGA